MKLLLSILAWLILGLTVDVSAASAQEPGRVYKIGWLARGNPTGTVPRPEKWTGPWAAFRDTMRDNGYVLGKNLVIDLRDAKGDINQVGSDAEALVASKVDVIGAWETVAIAAAMRATKTIPIVFRTAYPVERGFVRSLVNHGSNLTGQAADLSKYKLWQFLREAVPSLRRAGYVAYAPNSFAQDRSPEFRAKRFAILGSEAAQASLELVDLWVDRFEELEPKIAALASGVQAGLFLNFDPTLMTWRAEILSMAMRHRLPTACDQWYVGKDGCLVAYSQDDLEVYRRAAAQVVKIFNGTKPADIPIEQGTKFILAINAKTAKALDLTLPPSLLALADEVIE